MAAGVARRIRVNDRGQRIGEGHHMAKLTDAEVDQLIADRGPEDKPLMSYSQLSARYGISKSSVRDYLIGRRRGQAGMTVDKPAAAMVKQRTVPAVVLLTLAERAKMRRLGGNAWVRACLRSADGQEVVAPNRLEFAKDYTTNDAHSVVLTRTASVPPLVGLGGIAKLLGVCEQTARTITLQQWFPEPLKLAKRQVRWLANEVDEALRLHAPRASKVRPEPIQLREAKHGREERV